MSVPRGRGAEVLSRDSPEYRVHARIIADLEERAVRLGALQRRFRDEIVTSAGVVCDRPREDQRASVSRSYFHAAVRVIRLEQDDGASEQDRAWAAAMRDLLEQILTVRLSILDRAAGSTSHTEAQSTVEAYAAAVREIEQHCADHQIPSLLPNLFLPSSLFTQLQRSDYDPRRGAPVAAVYRKLAEIFAWQPRHLHAVATMAGRHGDPALTSSCVGDAGAMRRETVLALCRENPILAETCVVSLFEQGKHQDVLDLCQELPGESLVFSGVFEKRVRSLCALRLYEELMAFLDRHGASAPDDRSVRKAVGVACEEIGWYLYGLGRHADAVAFLDRHVAVEIGPRGRGNMNTLYACHLQAIGDEQRTAAFQRSLRQGSDDGG